jgi:hypothetical protein
MEAIVDPVGCKNSANAVEADKHEIRATHNSFLRHDRAKAVAAAEILMGMRHGPPNTAATICRRERARDKVSIIVGAKTTGGKKHIRFRWSVATNGRNAKIHVEVTIRKKTAGRPYTF